VVPIAILFGNRTTLRVIGVKPTRLRLLCHDSVAGDVWPGPLPVPNRLFKAFDWRPKSNRSLFNDEQVSVVAEESLKTAAFILYLRQQVSGHGLRHLGNRNGPSGIPASIDHQLGRADRSFESEKFFNDDLKNLVENAAIDPSAVAYFFNGLPRFKILPTVGQSADKFVDLWAVLELSPYKADPFGGRDSKPVLLHHEAALLANIFDEIQVFSVDGRLVPSPLEFAVEVEGAAGEKKKLAS